MRNILVDTKNDVIVAMSNKNIRYVKKINRQLEMDQNSNLSKREILNKLNNLFNIIQITNEEYSSLKKGIIPDKFPYSLYY
jgi:hypothetical protein